MVKLVELYKSDNCKALEALIVKLLELYKGILLSYLKLFFFL